MAGQDEPTVPRVIPADRLRLAGGRTLRFEGVQHGSGVSFFLVTNAPGQGPGLHRHPYSETWSVLDGEATIRIGEHEVVARTGDTAVVPPDTWHRFTNTGAGDLRMICIHASPVMIQEDAEEDPSR
ncbi:cupin domain-containing protein [Cellulomonas sp. Sa3CUA2]|uniref:Cupin domain-containing protein n=1 Tax=Cellulomonas avistercoris TaxID=2762242 RepID=A0ABR8QHL3_9CELL|nr:cupin domain-containing protein [Cellulomonas avistercoris]MBD7919925.1 cupin domain-containing protein [Cellulomonas avistercoris]